MPNRREFLAISLASSALPILAGEQGEGTPYLEANNTASVRSGLVVIEMTSPLALAFRAEAVEQGLETHGIQDDITDLWYHHLDRQWRTEPATLAGITLSTSLFCLETFARDHGMRVWFRAIHNETERVMSGDEPWSSMPPIWMGNGPPHSQDSPRPCHSRSPASSNRRLWRPRRCPLKNRVPWFPGSSRRV